MKSILLLTLTLLGIGFSQLFIFDHIADSIRSEPLRLLTMGLFIISCFGIWIFILFNLRKSRSRRTYRDHEFKIQPTRKQNPFTND